MRDNLSHYPITLPLHPKVLFVDWHGVLSTRLLWQRLDGELVRELRLSPREVTKRVFSNPNVDDWMRGAVSFREAVGWLSDDCSVSEASCTQLWLTALNDFKRTRINPRLVARLQRLRKTHEVVLATDNFEVFNAAYAKRANLHHLFDGMINSCNQGALKKESPRRFFGPWLDARGLTFNSATLIDDRSDNGAAFELAGGRFLQFRESPEFWHAIDHLEDPIAA